MKLKQSLTISIVLFVIVSLFVPVLPVYWQIVCFKAPCNPLLTYSTLIKVISNLSRIEGVDIIRLIINWLAAWIVVFGFGLIKTKFKNRQ